MPNPLWNSEEGRFRALLRLALHAVLLIVLSGLAGNLVLLAAGFFMEISAADITGLVQLGPAVSQNPLLVVLVSLGVLAGFIASVWLAGLWFDKRRFSSFGLHLNRQWWMDLLFGLFLGAFLMAAIFLLEVGVGWASITGTFASPGGNFTPAILAAAVLFIAVGIQEELLSRGYHLRNLAEGSNLPQVGARNALLVGWFLSSVVFGLLHLTNPNSSVTSTINLVLAGLFLGLGFVLTGELGISIGLHITWNFFQGNVFGFPVSGSEAGPTFIQIQQGGPALWTGGAFGPEAGLIGLLAVLFGSLLTLAWVRWTRGSARLQDHLAEYSPQQEN